MTPWRGQRDFTRAMLTVASVPAFGAGTGGELRRVARFGLAILAMISMAARPRHLPSNSGGVTIAMKRFAVTAALAMSAVLVIAQPAAASWLQQGTPMPSGASVWDFTAVSCASTTSCMAVGNANGLLAGNSKALHRAEPQPQKDESVIPLEFQ